MSVSELNGIAIAAVAVRNGIAIADIEEINGVPLPGNGAWLAGWSTRRKFTVESARVDAIFTGVIPIELNASAGIGSTDISSIFDEVGANYKKIAITSDDAETELEVEVEKWDNGAELARLFIRSAYSNAVDTEFYIYYDNGHGDNPNIKDPGDATALYPTGAAEEWECVYHLAEAGAADFIDSTDKNHDSADYQVTARQAVGLKGGHAVEFDAASYDYINTGIVAALRSFDDFTIIAVGYINAGHISSVAFAGLWPASDVWFLGSWWSGSANIIRVLVYDSNHTLDQVADDVDKRASWLRIIAQRARNDELQLWMNGVSEGVDGVANLATRPDLATPISIGGLDGAGDGNFTTLNMEGFIDEIWICNTKLSDAYIKALMYGFDDNLINWFAEEP